MWAIAHTKGNDQNWPFPKLELRGNITNETLVEQIPQ